LGNVQVIDEIFSREQVAEFLNFGDALVLPLVDFGGPYLGMSSKLYEYQAVGKPVICCAEGLPADYVRKTGSGIVVRPGDSEALAKAVTFLEESPRDARRMGKNGRKSVENDLSLEAIGLRMRRVFETLSRNE
jgi:glycosyltransferase involved in cell wall biosynthesis